MGVSFRPVYGENEPTAGDYLNRGISNALNLYLQGQEEKKRFRNAALEADPNATFSQEQTPWAKLMAHFGRTPFGRRPTGVAAPALPPSSAGPSQAVSQLQPQATMTSDGRSRYGISHAIGSLMPGDTSEPARSTIQGPGGMSARIDPYYGARQKAAINIAEEEGKARAQARYKDQPLTVNDRVRIAQARPSSGMTQSERIDLENLRQRGQLAIQALIARRGNSAIQAQAARAVQASLDDKVRQLRVQLNAARRAYDSQGAADIMDQLEEAREAADSFRSQLEQATGMATSRGPSISPEGEGSDTTAGRYNRKRTAPRTQRRPTVTETEPPPTTGRKKIVVPPPVRP